MSATTPQTTLPEKSRTWWKRFADSDITYSFTRSKVVMASAFVSVLLMLLAMFAPYVSPHDPTNLASLDLMNSLNPPAWLQGGSWDYPLGTDNQGRDMLSALLFGLRLSLSVSLASVILAMVLGITLGLVSGYFGGWADTVIMRIADIQMTFPAILTALLVNGVVRALLGLNHTGGSEYWVLVLSIGLSFWVQFARTVRGSAMVERSKDYVAAARLIGVRPTRIMFTHVLPNVLGPVLVIATISLALAIITEATLSFLGVGLPPSNPSLGTLVRVGNDFLLSGEWWIVFFPGLILAILALSVNMLGDWLRDALNPKLR